MLNREDIHRRARALGFAACGVTNVHCVPDEVMARYDAWLAEGCAAGMAYMHRHREIRRNPTLLLDGTRTIVCLSMGYTPSVEVEGFAHYAYGRDYHDVLRNRADELARLLLGDKAVANTDYRVCVDTAPIFERYWAAECGIGWIGRNHQLIIPHAGSEFLLCEILFTDTVDATDMPITSRCGTCHRCIDACPTGALRNDGMLDARRCNSYLTIEHRGQFTDHTPSPGCLYGCDHCQKVCPWQRFATPTTEAAFQPSPDFINMTQDDWKALTPEQFRTLFKYSAIKRTKYDGLMRNILTNQTSASITS